MNNKRSGAFFGMALGCSLLVVPMPCLAQNLVPNPSFELYDTCTYTIGFQWASKPVHWEKWLASPDYFSTCAGSLGSVDTLLRVPFNGFGFQYPWEGDSYIGMYTYKFNYREYVGAELLTPLVVGQTYSMRFWANVAINGTYWSVHWASNNLGLLFTMQPNIWTGITGPNFAFRNYAHLHSEEVISDSLNWTLVEGTFVADSAYRYLVIGNFFEDALTDTAHLEGGNSLGAYYFVDGVCVVPIGGDCEIPAVVPENIEPRVRLWPNPANRALSIEGAGDGFQMFDGIGRMVYEAGSNAHVVNLDLTEWPTGRYVIRTLGKRAFVGSFIVMH